MRKNKSGHAKDISKRSAYLMLLAIIVFSGVLSFSMFKGMSFYGDDFAYAGFMPLILRGGFQVNLNIFSLRLLLLFPMAFFVKIFGYTDLGAGLYAFICYLASILLVFLIGKEFYSNKASLLSALLFGIYPAIIKFNTEPNPMLPLIMFLLLSVLMFIYAKKKHNYWLYALSGIFNFAGALVNPLAYLYVLFFTVYIAVDFARGWIKKKPGPHYEYLIYYLGIVTALLILGFVNMYIAQNHNPFYELKLTNSYYSAAGGPDEIYYTNPSLTFYINGYFPYNATNTQDLANLFNIYSLNLNDVGFFSYFAVLLGIYLLATRNKKYWFVLAWGAFLVAYMEFGTMSITHYFPIYKLMRFTTIVAPPLMLILGFGIMDLEERLFGNKKLLKIIFIFVIVGFLFATSLPLDYDFYILNHNTTNQIKLMAQDLLKVPDLYNASVFGSALTPYYLDYYMGYAPTKNFGQYGNGKDLTLVFPTCSSIPNNTYLIIPNKQALYYINELNLWPINESWAFNTSECGLTLYANIYNSSAARGRYFIAYTGNIYYKR
ncbi:MAG: ArnT family glycosyltransferase [Candidatus Micrarchaeia archaeon]